MDQHEWTAEQWRAYEAATIQIRLADLDALLEGAKHLSDDAPSLFLDKMTRLVQAETFAIGRENRPAVDGSEL